MSFPPVNPDFERGKFLEKLDASDLMLSEWEQSFVTGYMTTGRRSLWFTAGRRAAADKMRMKFGHEPEINMPLIAPARAPIPEAVPGGCEFLKFDDSRRQVRCNAPAVWQRRTGFRLCDDCAETLRASMKRLKKTIHLEKWP